MELFSTGLCFINLIFGACIMHMLASLVIFVNHIFTAYTSAWQKLRNKVEFEWKLFVLSLW